MTDVLIRNVPEETLKRVDARAARLGLSRSEYLRRQIERDVARGDEQASREDLGKFERLGDEEWMRGAWS